MSDWSLSQLLASLHEDIQQRLATVRKTIQHPGSKGDASENVWIAMLDLYLPKRYQTAQSARRRQPGQFQPADRRRHFRPAVFALHLHL